MNLFIAFVFVERFEYIITSQLNRNLGFTELLADIVRVFCALIYFSVLTNLNAQFCLNTAKQCLKAAARLLKFK